MNIFNDLSLRSTRNLLIGTLFTPRDDTDFLQIAPNDTVFSFPVTNLPVCYEPNFTQENDDKANLFIFGAEQEENVEYLLRNETGEVVFDNQGGEIKGKTLELTKDQDFKTFINSFKDGGETDISTWKVFTGELLENSDEILTELKEKPDTFKLRWERIVVFNIEINTESTFSILVKSKNKQNPVKAFLSTTINYNAIINKNVEVAIVEGVNSDTELLPNDKGIFEVIDATKFAIKISNSQNKVNYQLVKIPQMGNGEAGNSINDTFEVVSGSVLSKGGDLWVPITSESQPEEEAEWAIRAFTKFGTGTIFNSVFLEENIGKEGSDKFFKIKVKIPLQSKIDFEVKPNESGGFSLQINNAQRNVLYEAFAFTFPLVYSFDSNNADYQPDGKLADDFINNFDPDDSKNSGDLVKADLSNLNEDSLLFVRANDQLWLEGESNKIEHQVVLVAPESDLDVEVFDNQILIKGAQLRTGYQLNKVGTPLNIVPTLIYEPTRIGWMRPSDNRVFGLPIKNNTTTHHGFYTVESVNSITKTLDNNEIETSPPPNEILLPLPPIPTASGLDLIEDVYEVIAIREYTGLTSTLLKKVKIDSNGNVEII